MSLPKIAIPQFTTLLPSNGEEITFRPFLVKEEKVLLMAAEAKDFTSAAGAVEQIIQACILTPGIKVKDMPFFDAEHVFIKIRAKSVGEIVKLRYQHKDGVNRTGTVCNEVSEIDVDLEKVETAVPPKDHMVVMVSPTIGIKLKYPTLNQMLSLTVSEKQIETSKIFDLLADCIESVFEGDVVSIPDNKKQTAEFVELLPGAAIKGIVDFFQTIPTASYALNYTCKKCGQAENVKLSGLKDFF